MSNNTLPPELVEKFDNEINKFQISSDIFRQLHLKNKCTHIAVDYADEENKVVINAMHSVVDEYNIIKQQRDELIDGLRLAIHHMSLHGLSTGKYRGLLKKHEDGKE